MTPDAQDILVNLKQTENIVRTAIVAAFGLSSLLNGYVLQKRAAKVPRVSFAFRVARHAYIFGTGFLIAFCTLAIISPATSTSALVTVGIPLVLALIALSFDKENPGVPALQFLSGALIFLIIAASAFLFPAEAASATDLGWLSVLHIVTAIAGEGLCIVAFCASLLYVWDYRRLKKKILERTPFLPSLDTLDRTIEKTTLIGLGLISTSLISGISLTFGAAAIEASLVKIIWAFTVWIWFVMAIFGREFLGWRGRRGAHLTIWGAVLMLIALFGTIWPRS